MGFTLPTTTANYAAQVTILDNPINNNTKSLALIKRDIEEAFNIVRENIDHGFTGNLTSLEKAFELLDNLSVYENQLKVIDKKDTKRESGYTVVFENSKLFSITFITSETRFATETTSGDDATINLENSFDKWYKAYCEPNGNPEYGFAGTLSGDSTPISG